MKKTFLLPIILLITTFIFLLASCKKEANLSKPIAFVSIYNATLNSLNFKIGGKPTSGTSLARGAYSGYIGAYEGEWDFNVLSSNSDKAAINERINLKGNELQSFFIIKEDSLKYLTVKDDMTVRNPDRPVIKFLNLSPDAQQLTLELVLLSNKVAFTNVQYKSYSPYQEVDEKTSYTISLKASPTSELDILTVTQAFERNKLYTIWTTGLANSSDDANRISLHITEVK